MSYSVYLNEKRIYHHISEEEALRRQKMFRQMIHAGVKSCYSPEQVTIKYDSVTIK